MGFINIIKAAFENQNVLTIIILLLFCYNDNHVHLQTSCSAEVLVVADPGEGVRIFVLTFDLYILFGLCICIAFDLMNKDG